MHKQMPPLWIQTTRQPLIVAHSGFNVSMTLRDRRTLVIAVDTAADSRQTITIYFGTASPLVRHLLGAQADMMTPRLIPYVVVTIAYLQLTNYVQNVPNWDRYTIVGTNQEIFKDYLRLTTVCKPYL
jgi:hypothetical protein